MLNKKDSALFNVVNKFLTLAKENDLKLHKNKLMQLVYLAHCHSLHSLEKPLFSNKIIACDYAPVIPDLEIVIENYDIHIDPELPKESFTFPNDDTERFISSIFSAYEGWSGTKLECFTSRHGSPWSQVKAKISYGGTSNEITDDLIKEYYRDLEREYLLLENVNSQILSQFSF